MSSMLERRYRLLLSAYPDAYRDTHEDEILGTLLDAAEPGQIYPNPREVIGLVAGGLRTRARLAAEAGRAGVWADGLRLAALLLLVSLLPDRVFLFASPLSPVLLAMAAVAVVFGATRIGLAAVALTVLWPAGIGAGILSVGTNSIYLEGLGTWMLWGRNSYGVWATLVVTATLSWLSLRGGHRRPWPWWVAALAITIPALYGLSVTGWARGLHIPLSTFELVLPVMLLTGISLVGNDPRPSIAAAVYILVHVVVAASTAVDLTAVGLNPFLTAVGLNPIPILLLQLGLAATAIFTSIVSSRRLAHYHP